MVGIIFTGGEGPKSAYIKQILARFNVKPLIIAADSGAILAINAGIKPDYITGDLDSIDSSLLETFPAGSVIHSERGQDFTDTELALELLREKNCSEIRIAGGGGGRLDHLLAIRALFDREDCPARWVTAAEDVRCLNQGEKLELNLPKDTQVSVFPAGEGQREIQSSGLKWPLDNVKWDRGSFGISNRTTADFFTVRVVRGRFLIIIPLKKH